MTADRFMMPHFGATQQYVRAEDYEAVEAENVLLRRLLKKIADMDQGAITEMHGMGFVPPPEALALLDEVRKVLRV